MGDIPPGQAGLAPPHPPMQACPPGPSTFRAVRVCWCLSLPFSILFLFSLAFPLVITLELFTRLIHSSTVRHLSNTHWLDSPHVESGESSQVQSGPWPSRLFKRPILDQSATSRDSVPYILSLKRFLYIEPVYIEECI